jgi:hypothetical protein
MGIKCKDGVVLVSQARRARIMLPLVLAVVVCCACAAAVADVKCFAGSREAGAI